LAASESLTRSLSLRDSVYTRATGSVPDNR
jgi:hypothetical protein